MCLPVIGLVMSVAGTFATAFMQSAMAKQQAAIEQRQLKTEIENEKLKAMADTNDRLESFRRDEASNRAALSALGFDNQSYEQGVEPFNRKVVSRDVRSIEFNAGQEIGRKKYEIKVAGWRAKSTARSGFIEAGASAAGQVGSYLINNTGGGNSTFQGK